MTVLLNEYNEKVWFLLSEVTNYLAYNYTAGMSITLLPITLSLTENMNERYGCFWFKQLSNLAKTSRIFTKSRFFSFSRKQFEQTIIEYYISDQFKINEEKYNEFVRQKIVLSLINFSFEVKMNQL